MSTPTGRPEDEPIEEPVRQLFWRLRARLVTPPQEQRAQADLDRLLELARMHAHEAPSADASATPAVVGDARPADHPAGAPQLRSDAEVVRGRFARVHALGRVAAAAMVMFAFGAGAMTARNGEVSIDALLGREGRELPLSSPELPAADEPATDEVPGGETPGDAPSGSDTDAPVEEPSTLAAPPTDVPANDTPPVESTPQEPAPAPTDPAPPAGRGTTPNAPVDADLIAAPAPDGFDGFGGPLPCPEGSQLTDCVGAEEETDEPADDGAGEDAVTDTEAVRDDAQDLARRRFGGQG